MTARIIDLENACVRAGDRMGHGARVRGERAGSCKPRATMAFGEDGLRDMIVESETAEVCCHF